MFETIGKYLAVVGLSMFKFIFGPALGESLSLTVYENATLTVVGMMLTVVVVQLLGQRVRGRLILFFYKNKKVFSKRNRRIVQVWRSYGMWGVAILTPVLFSPPGGALIAVSFGERFGRVFSLMLISAVFWAIVFSILFDVFGSQVLGY